MEHCPHCDAPGREGAKYCTSCGYRFPNDDDLVMVNTMSAPYGPVEDTGAVPSAESTIAGWPAPPTQLPADSAWPSQPPPEAPRLELDDEERAPPFWEGDLGAWPDAPNQSLPADRVATESTTTPIVAGVATLPENAAAARARANQLLDELRTAISALNVDAPPDLSGVISDLEVAVTPPGALAADDVSDLREALLAAREKPREIDTMLDLSRRIDAMVALVIAYDRTIAAIERSLDVLRRA